MKQFLLTAGMLMALGSFVFAQDNTSSQSTTTTQTQNAPAASSSTATHPEGTHVTGHTRDTLVQPTIKPVEITPSIVKAAQQKLTDGGYNPGPVDGILGPQTQAALKKFQQKESLTPNGQLDRETMAKLNVGGVQQVESAPADLGRGGKAFGKDISEGHPVEAGKAGAKGAESFGKKVASGSKSEAIKAKDKVASGLSTVGEKVTHTGSKTKKAGEPVEQNNPQQ